MNDLQTAIVNQTTATLKTTFKALDALITNKKMSMKDLDAALLVRKYMLQELEIRDIEFVTAWYDIKVVAA